MNYRADDIRSCNGALNSEKNIFLKSELQPIKSYYLYLAKYFQSEKYYAIGSLCGALLYNENGKEKFMFYDANFSNVAGVDNFGNIVYSNEYGPNGDILHSIDYSNISFGCSLYDEDLNSYIEKPTGASSIFTNLSYSISKHLPTFKKISIISRSTAKSSGPPTDWIWIWLPSGMRDCFDSKGGVDLSCLFWDSNIGEGEGGGGGVSSNECTYTKANTRCYCVCPKIDMCQACCNKVKNECYLIAGIIATLEVILVTFEPYHGISYLFHGLIGAGVLGLCDQWYYDCLSNCNLAGQVC